MSRIFSAMENNEDQVLNQLEDDINMALEDGTCEACGQYSIEKIDDSTVKINDLVNDESTIADLETDGEIKLSNPKDEILKASKTRSFAAGKLKGDLLIVRMHDQDIAIDLNKGVAYLEDDPRMLFAEFKGTEKFDSVLDKIEAGLKKWDLIPSKTRNHSRTFTAKHIAEHINNQKMNNLDKLDPEVKKNTQDEFKKRFNKTRNFTKAK